MYLIKNQILIIMSWIQELNYRFGLETLIMKKRIIVFGLEPKDTNLIFNLEKVKKNIFGPPLSIDRYNAK